MYSEWASSIAWEMRVAGLILMLTGGHSHLLSVDQLGEPRSRMP
jgi:hypothetical protein